MNLNEKMKKKGEATVTQIIAVVIAVFVLVVVAYGLYSFFSGKPIPFFQWLPGFNRTVSRVEGIELLRYDLIDGKAQYYDKTNWIDFANELRLGDRVLNYDNIKNDFIEYLNSAKGTEFRLRDGDGRIYKISDSNSESFVVFRGENDWVKFLYNGGVFITSKNNNFVEVGRFNRGDEDEDGLWEYYFLFDNKRLEGIELSDEQLFGHLSNLGGFYLQSESVGGTWSLSKYIFGIEPGLTGYEWEPSSGNVYFRGKKIENLRIGLDSEGLPIKIEARAINEFIKLDKLEGEYLNLRNGAFGVIFGRNIGVGEGTYVPLFKDNRYIVVELGKGVNLDA